MQQFFKLKRLGDETFGAEPRDLDRLPNRAVPRDHNYDDVGITRQRFVNHLPPIDSRQAEVRNENVESELSEPLQSGFTGSRLFDTKSLVGQSFRDDFTERRLVIDEEQVRRTLRHSKVTAF